MSLRQQAPGMSNWTNKARQVGQAISEAGMLYTANMSGSTTTEEDGAR
jgi:hypothetical protein